MNTAKQLPVGSLVRVLPKTNPEVDGKIGLLISNDEVFQEIYSHYVVRFAYCVVLIDTELWDLREEEIEPLL